MCVGRILYYGEFRVPTPVGPRTNRGPNEIRTVIIPNICDSYLLLQCMLQSWYLAVDMQLFWLSPLVLYSLWRWPRVGLIKLAVLVVISIIIPFYVAWVYKIKAPIPLTLK